MSNRTTVKSNIVAQNVPTVTNAILTGMLNTQLADNIRFREDVAVIQNSSVTSITVDFTGKDRVDLTRTGGALSITVSGIGDGEEKYLLITKTAGQAVTFVGVTDITPVPANVNALSTVVYQIIRKNNEYLCMALANTLAAFITSLGNAAYKDTGTTAGTVAAGDDARLSDARENFLVGGGTLHTKIIDIGDWDMDTTTEATIAHGLADYKKIREVSAMIRDDTDSVYLPLVSIGLTSGFTEVVNGGVGEIGSTNIRLVKVIGARFDSSSFNSTGFNRGWITIKYID